MSQDAVLHQENLLSRWANVLRNRLRAALYTYVADAMMLIESASGQEPSTTP